MLVFTPVILTYPSIAFPWVLDSTWAYLCSLGLYGRAGCTGRGSLPWQRFGLCYYRGASYFRTKVLWFCFDSLVLLVATFWPAN